jgi:hypothetical protein
VGLLSGGAVFGYSMVSGSSMAATAGGLAGMLVALAAVSAIRWRPADAMTVAAGLRNNPRRTIAT